VRFTIDFGRYVVLLTPHCNECRLGSPGGDIPLPSQVYTTLQLHYTKLQDSTRCVLGSTKDTKDTYLPT